MNLLRHNDSASQMQDFYSSAPPVENNNRQSPIREDQATLKLSQEKIDNLPMSFAFTNTPGKRPQFKNGLDVT